ncbi:hypothetical protein MTO96_040455 [Rhipicephalus appendiculatus]
MGDDSDFGDLSDSDDEYVPDTRKEGVADPTVQDNSDDSSQDEAEVTDSHGGTGSVDRGHWRKRLLDASLPVFSESGTEPMVVENPLTYFRKFITSSMLSSVVEQTNLYSAQETGKSINLTVHEIEKYIGMYLMMGLVQMPSVRCYWEHGTRFPAVADVMPRNRFERLMRFLHFEDNINATEDAKQDKVWKIRKWLNALQENIRAVEPEELNSVDEIMISFTGRCPIKQYMPAKPHPWGIKLWGRAGTSGYLYQFDVYQGQQNKQYRFGLGGDVVIRMCEFLPQHKGHKVAADNFFSSLELAEELAKTGLGFIGTLRNNRLRDCRLKTESDLKKEGRGAFDYVVNTVKDIVVVRWYDNRWYLYLFYHSIMTAMVNAWLVYRRHCFLLKQKHVNLRQFQASVAETLLAVGKRPVGRPSLSAQPATKKRKATEKPPEHEVRLDGVGHMPMWSSSRLRCKSCPWQKHSFSYAYCIKCNVHLCFNKDRNCFAAYHQ